MSLTISLRDRDYGVLFTILNHDGTPFNLTGWTIALKAWRAGVPGTIVINVPLTIQDALRGTCVYLVRAADTATREVYLAEIELVRGSTIRSTQPFEFVIVEGG